LVLPDRVWRELDVNVTALFSRRELLAALGLGTNRGVLLVGPPGTGKTGVCRTLAAELIGRVTVLFCDARAMAGRLGELYSELVFLGPSLVVLEDIDLVVGHRRAGSSGTLLEFLTALDGAISRHRDVITLATTNDAAAIDDAAKRAARFDRIVKVPLPDVTARTTILTRYLGPLGDEVDIPAVAVAAAGASGADLRELVRRSVLEYGDQIDTAALLRLVRTGSWHPTAEVGHYL
jgi:SpoVK/Ycf46/Vps4 family AAA+-type ATPase